MAMTNVTLDNTLGAAFLGAFSSCILFGITVVQTHFYYTHYPKDWQFQKISVAIIMTLVTLNTIFVVHAVYYSVITNFGNMAAFTSIVWSFKSQAIVYPLMISFVQSLYVLRVWKLGSHVSRLWPALLGFAVAGGSALGIVLVVKTYQIKSFMNLDEIRPFIYACFIAATSIDVALATAMCYCLNRSRSSFVGTNNKIFVVMRYVLASGCLTSACSLSSLIMYAIMPHNMVFTAIGFLLPNLYTNSYIAMLNARRSINERETLSITEGTNARSGLTLAMDGINIHSVDDTKSPDGTPLSAKRFTFASSFSKIHDPGQGMPSTPLGILVHRTEERQYS